jgi:hypothetical protein
MTLLRVAALLLRRTLREPPRVRQEAIAAMHLYPASRSVDRLDIPGRPHAVTSFVEHDQ